MLTVINLCIGCVVLFTLIPTLLILSGVFWSEAIANSNASLIDKIKMSAEEFWQAVWTD